VLEQNGGANHVPAPRWHRERAERGDAVEVRYYAPDGSLLRSRRDVTKYLDAHPGARADADDCRGRRRPLSPAGHFTFSAGAPAAAALDRAAVASKLRAAWDTAAESERNGFEAQAKTLDKAHVSKATAAARFAARNAALECGAHAAQADRLAVFALDAALGASKAADAPAEERSDAAAADDETDDDDDGDDDGEVALDEGDDGAPPRPGVLQAAQTQGAARYNVLERLERLFAGGELAAEDSDDGSEAMSYYESDDSFIDDADIFKHAQSSERAERTKPSKFDGFFVSSGDLDTQETSPSKQRPRPPKRRRSNAEPSRGEGLSPPQMTALLISNASLVCLQVNPKTGKSGERYDKYKSATTAHELLALGASRADVRNDVAKGHVILGVEALACVEAAVAQSPAPILATTAGRPLEAPQPKKKKSPPQPCLDGDAVAREADSPPAAKKALSPSKLSNPKPPRKKRCGACAGCAAEECLTCKYCLDRPKRGGSGTLRKPCVQRACIGEFEVWASQ